MAIDRTEYRNPSLVVLSLYSGNLLCVSAGSSFDDWVDDGEIPVTSDINAPGL